jgi:hypothetical protein
MQYSEQHAGRALGRASWDLDGPRYVVGNDGRAVRHGRLNDSPTGVGVHLFTGRYRPEILKWLDWKRLFWVSESDRQFFVALLGTARERLSDVYRSAEWHLVLLDTEPHPDVLNGLLHRGVAVHPIGSILPTWRPGHPDYSIAGDGHPNRRYNEELARWFSERILGLRR